MALRRAPAAALLWSALVSLLPFHDVVAQDEVDDRGQANPRVVVLDDGRCGGVPPTELRELIKLELAPRVLQGARDERAATDATTVTLRCSAESAHIAVHERGRAAQELALDLSSIAAAARARLIALSMAELLATADMEPLEPLAESTAEAPSSPPASPPSSVWLGVGLARAGTPRVLAPSLHTGLVLNVAGLPLALQVQVDAQRGERDVPAGHVTLWTTSGFVGPATQLRIGPLDVVLGAGVRLGYARLVGDAAQTSVTGHAVSGVWWGPTLDASATLRISKRVGLRAGIDLRWIARAVRGTDGAEATAFELDGLVVHTTLGLSLTTPALRVGRHQQTL